MHTNHRRKNKFRSKHHNVGHFWLPYSLKWWKSLSWARRRARAREAMGHARWDELPRHYRRDIAWQYW